MKHSYADLSRIFDRLKQLNGQGDKPYLFKDQACYAIAKNMNVVRRHLREFNAKFEAIGKEHAELIEDAKKAGGEGLEEVLKKLSEETNAKIKELNATEVEIAPHVVKHSALNLDSNAIQPGLVADLIDSGFVE